MVPAHRQTLHVDVLLRLYIPEHEPRAKDPHRSVFLAAKRKARKLDVRCWRCGVKPSDIARDGVGVATEHNPHGARQHELHHAVIEFSLQSGVDLAKFKATYPEFDVTDQDSFLRWLDSEGNLLQLCDFCHRSPQQGIHSIPYPLWLAERTSRDDLPPLIAD